MPTLLGYYGYFDRTQFDRLDRFGSDERAIEGLPIRLVIALVVGVASLGVMMNMLSGIGGLTVTELDAKPDPTVMGPDKQEVSVTVVDPDGKPVEDATVVITGGTATLGNVETATTDAAGEISVDVDPELGPNQRQGTLEVSIKPPAGSDYADEQENTAILVVRE
ncbi:DUF7382 domain-containing protein [Halorussus lipolyticus]|uniref:DUF7382 domain-containing protein n=1 Tax=Halorussus lipolyticus TaxID=3034024 RepID=UPI0023E8338E|nr:carboxypeptidase regulatory-like domain-containing protein [Halorussus sp. DT80]